MWTDETTGSCGCGQDDEDMRMKEEAESMCCHRGADDGRKTCGRCKNTPRDAGQQKQLQNRLNRIIGQLNGIKKMIDDNRYCGDILIQIAAVESALQSLGYTIFQDHMQTCVAEEVRKGNQAVLTEAVELARKLK